MPASRREGPATWPGGRAEVDLGKVPGAHFSAPRDEVSRSTRDVLNLVHELTERGASLRVLEPAIDTNSPVGKLS
jgi:Resolvase, N terminal domain